MRDGHPAGSMPTYEADAAKFSASVRQWLLEKKGEVLKPGDPLNTVIEALFLTASWIPGRVTKAAEASADVIVDRLRAGVAETIEDANFAMRSQAAVLSEAIDAGIAAQARAREDIEQREAAIRSREAAIVDREIAVSRRATEVDARAKALSTERNAIVAERHAFANLSILDRIRYPYRQPGAARRQVPSPKPGNSTSPRPAKPTPTISARPADPEAGSTGTFSMTAEVEDLVATLPKRPPPPLPPKPRADVYVDASGMEWKQELDEEPVNVKPTVKRSGGWKLSALEKLIIGVGLVAVAAMVLWSWAR